MADDTRHDPLEGTGYAAEQRIGSGGMGDVFRAVHRKLGKRVAVKILKQHKGAAGQQVVERLRYEAQAAARIDDPRLVQVFDMGVTGDGRAFYVMELLEGRSLQGEIDKRGALPVREVRRIMLGLLQGLEALHREGLVHRDIKPSNVFYCAERLNQPRRIKILDLGVVKRHPTAPKSGVAAKLKPISAPTKPGLMVGSPRYCSPEQALGSQIDHRSDLYSAGLVLYALLTGRHTTADKRNVVDVLLAQMHELPPAPSEHAPITSELDAVVMRAIAKDPEERYASAPDFAAALRAARIDPLAATTAPAGLARLPGKTELITAPLDERAGALSLVPPPSAVPPPSTVPITQPIAQSESESEPAPCSEVPPSQAPASEALLSEATSTKAPSTMPLSLAEVASLARLSAPTERLAAHPGVSQPRVGPPVRAVGRAAPQVSVETAGSAGAATASSLAAAASKNRNTWRLLAAQLLLLLLLILSIWMVW